MVERAVKLPDVGEGVAEAEVVEWHVKIGDLVQEDSLLAAVMTDKATVEVPSPVSGQVIWLGAAVGDRLAVGSDLVRLKVAGEEQPSVPAQTEQVPTVATPAASKPIPSARSAKPRTNEAVERPSSAPVPPAYSPNETAEVRPLQRLARAVPRPTGEKPLAPPAVRLRAREAGVDLRQVPGTGPAGRITHDDLDAFIARGPAVTRTAGLQAKTGVTDVKLVGLRRKIAERMAIANAHIAHITYVDEIDVSNLEDLRATLNKQKRQEQPKLTLLPFLMRAMVRAIAEQPNLNALYDDETGVLHVHSGVHIGIAAQTSAGLMVPVVRHVEALDLWACAAEMIRLTEAARSGTATREELSGSTITITSLGAMGGVVTTPIINHPEVAIVGVNKIVVRPVWNGTSFVPRKMMNLSSSFDHRVIDGWDAAQFVQRIKVLLESPAQIFMED
jgi:2-oxoisovalerate dehydrogenase E2 component (dihydrolipoyl transacylase)